MVRIENVRRGTQCLQSSKYYRWNFCGYLFRSWIEYRMNGVRSRHVRCAFEKTIDHGISIESGDRWTIDFGRTHRTGIIRGQISEREMTRMKNASTDDRSLPQQFRVNRRKIAGWTDTQVLASNVSSLHVQRIVFMLYREKATFLPSQCNRVRQVGNLDTTGRSQVRVDGNADTTNTLLQLRFCPVF